MRVNGRWLAALLLLAVLPLSGCGFSTKLQSRDRLNKGVKAFSDQKYADAVMYFNKSIELDPTIEEAHMYLATAYMMQYIPGSIDPKNEDNAQKAIQTFTDVVRRSEEKGKPNINAMLAIANLNYQLKDIDQTRDWCTRVLELEAVTEEEKIQKAEAHYRIAVLLYDNVHERTGILGEKVQTLEQADKDQIMAYIDEGLGHLEASIGIRPDYFDAMMYQNLLWREKAKFETDEAAKAELIRQADMVALQSLELRRKAMEEEAKRPKKLGI